MRLQATPSGSHEWFAVLLTILTSTDRYTGLIRALKALFGSYIMHIVFQEIYPVKTVDVTVCEALPKLFRREVDYVLRTDIRSSQLDTHLDLLASS